MRLAIRHAIPGRLRLHAPDLCRKRSVADGFEDWLTRQSGVKTVRFNFVCDSLVVEYDRASHGLLREVLRQF